MKSLIGLWGVVSSIVIIEAETIIMSAMVVSVLIGLSILAGSGEVRLEKTGERIKAYMEQYMSKRCEIFNDVCVGHGERKEELLLNKLESIMNKITKSKMIIEGKKGYKNIRGVIKNTKEKSESSMGETIEEVKANETISNELYTEINK